jgi:hypothetical protein
VENPLTSSKNRITGELDEDPPASEGHSRRGLWCAPLQLAPHSQFTFGSRSLHQVGSSGSIGLSCTGNVGAEQIALAKPVRQLQ